MLEHRFNPFLENMTLVGKAAPSQRSLVNLLLQAKQNLLSLEHFKQVPAARVSQRIAE
jgi:hypothetical protein